MIPFEKITGCNINKINDLYIYSKVPIMFIFLVTFAWINGKNNATVVLLPFIKIEITLEET